MEEPVEERPSKKEVAWERERVREVIRKIRDEVCKMVLDKLESLREINQRFEDQVPLSFFRVAFPVQYQKIGPNARESVYKRMIIADFVKTQRSEGASPNLSDTDILCRHISNILMSYLSYHFVPSGTSLDSLMQDTFTKDVRMEVLKYFIGKSDFDKLRDLAPYSYLAAQLLEDMKNDFHNKRRTELANLFFWSCLFKRRWYFNIPGLKMDISLGIEMSKLSLNTPFTAPRLTCTIRTTETRARLFISIFNTQEEKKDFISPPFLKGFEANTTKKVDNYHQVTEKITSFKICDDRAYLDYLNTTTPRRLCKSLVLLNVAKINDFLSRFVAFITTEGIDLEINVSERDYEISSFFGMKTVAQELLGEKDYDPQTTKDFAYRILKNISHPTNLIAFISNLRDGLRLLLKTPNADLQSNGGLVDSEALAIRILQGLLNAYPEIVDMIPEIMDVVKGCYKSQLLLFDVEEALLQFGISHRASDWKLTRLRPLNATLAYKNLRKELKLDESANLALSDIPDKPLEMEKIPILLIAASLNFWQRRY